MADIWWLLEQTYVLRMDEVLTVVDMVIKVRAAPLWLHTDCVGGRCRSDPLNAHISF
jgi:hypothetical protein